MTGIAVRRLGLPTFNCDRRQCCRTTVAFLFSHIGLTALVVGYSVMGALLFQHLEQGHELQRMSLIRAYKEEAVGNIWAITTDMHVERSLQDHCTTNCEPLKGLSPHKNSPPTLPTNVSAKISALKFEMIDSLWNFTLELNVLWKENWTALADNRVTNFLWKAQDLLDLEKNAKNDGVAEPKIQCSTTCAVFVNSTSEMKKNWTTAVAETFNMFHHNITDLSLDGAKGHRVSQKWTFSSSFLYALSVITTIGYGHITPKTPQGKIVTILYAIVGIPIMLLFLANVGDFLARIFRGIFAYISRCKFGRASRPKSPSRRHGGSGRRSQDRSRKRRPRLRNVGQPATVGGEVPPIASTWDTDDEIVELSLSEPKKDSKSGAVLGCLAIMGTYLFSGATLFALWEDWPYLDAFYFCFVTLTTIGFGDFVPGASLVTNETSSQRLVVCCVYVLVGLALMACCFNLLQEQVRWYANTLARIMGLADESKENENAVIQTDPIDLDT